MKKYLFDTFLFAWRVLHPRLRNKFWLGFLNALLTPLSNLWQIFWYFAFSARERAAFNSQTGVFEFLLNQRFNNGAQGIFIDNVYFNASIAQEYKFYIEEEGFGFPSSHYYFLTESNPTSFMSFLEELFSFGATFIVNVPAALEGNIDENELRAVIDRYRLIDKTYKIEYYE